MLQCVCPGIVGGIAVIYSLGMTLIENYQPFSIRTGYNTVMEHDVVSLKEQNMLDDRIHWQTWDDEAVRRAEREDKPILLDLDATWCHWCHVMEQTTYSDADVIRLVNDHYIPIRVDPDRRPDINDRYNQGGWPTTAFLAPTGEVLFGATYIPPDQMKGILEKMIDLWHTQREELRSSINSFRSALRQEQRQPATPVESNDVPGDALHMSFQRIREYYDYAFGGFATGAGAFAPKFPFPEAVSLSLLYFEQTHAPDAEEIAKKTLDAMLALEDMEEGGFFRYAVNRNWTEPHYEKMMQTNAALLQTYLYAWRLFKDDRYRQAVTGIIQWATQVMSQPEGGFCGSQDADGEAAYYGVDLEERRKMPRPSVDQTVFCDWSASMSRSFLDASVLLDDPDAYGHGLRSLDWLLSNCRNSSGVMYHYWHDGKAFLPGMLRDQTAMILGLSRAYQVSGINHYLQAITELSDILLRDLQDESVGGFFDIGHTDVQGGIEFRQRKDIIENAFTVSALLELHEITGVSHYRNAALRALAAFTEGYVNVMPSAAQYALAAWLYSEGGTTIAVVGRRESERAQSLIRKSIASNYPFAVAHILDPEYDIERLEQLGLPIQNDTVTAYLCREKVCQMIE